MPDPHIGLLRERGLHAALKALYARPGDGIEVRLPCGVIVDVLRADGEVIEVQTGGFSPLKRKLPRLLPDHPVRIVQPLPVEKWIVREDAAGRTLSRRKSPVKAAPAHAFRQWVYIADWLTAPGLTLDILLVSLEQTWRDDGRGSWRRAKWSLAETRLLAVRDQIPVSGAADLRAFLPDGLPDAFTTADLAAAGRLPAPLAGKIAFCLRTAGVIAQTGKRGRAYLYTCTG